MWHLCEEVSNVVFHSNYYLNIIRYQDFRIYCL